MIWCTMNWSQRDVFFRTKRYPLRVPWKIFKRLLFINFSFPKCLIVNIIIWFILNCPILSFYLFFLCFFAVRILRWLVYVLAFKFFLLVFIFYKLWDIDFKAHFFQSIVKSCSFFHHIIQDSLILKTFFEYSTYTTQS